MSAKTHSFRHVLAAETYAKAVISGKIPACRWVKLACKRHFADLKSAKTKAFPYEFDAAKAERVCKFAELLPHTKGKWAKKDPKNGQYPTIKLEPWQQFCLCMIFGWVKKKSGKRRFLKARLYIPRKNGKSLFGAVIGLFMFVLDSEPGAEIYSGATSEKQAMEVFRVAWEMVKRTPALAARFGILVTGKTDPGPLLLPDGSKFEPVIGNPGDGASPHCAITDEYHEHKTSALLDTMETGMGARDQPLSLVISTAGSNVAGPCREDWKTCERILEGTSGFEDETTFCIIWTIDPGDPWDSIDSLKKANPNWGVSINTEQMEAKLRTARQRANQQSAFRTKHLNEWVNSREAYFNLTQWNALARPDIKREDFKEYPSFIACDLSVKHDLTVAMQLFCLPDRKYAVFGHYYLPEVTVNLPENQHYRNWHISGHLEMAGDEIVDYDFLKSHLLELCKDYTVLEIPSDPWNGWQTLADLEEEGAPVVVMELKTKYLSEPMKELDAKIRSGDIIHNGDPILTWAIGNTLAKLDPNDNVFPRKENAASKIDPVVATIMAMSRAMARKPTPIPVFAW